MFNFQTGTADIAPVRTLHPYRAWLNEQHYSPRTRDQYLAYVRRARQHCGPLHQATTDTLYAWWSTLPPSASSRNGARNALVAYYRHRGRANPAEGLPCLPLGEGLPRPVAFDVYESLFAAASTMGGHHHMLYMLLAYTGCRINEARVARRHQFDLHAGRWRIAGKGSHRRGPKERVVAIHPDLAAAVGAYPAADWIFPSPHRDGPVHRTTIGQWMRELADQAQVTATAHQIRHAVATIGLERTRDIRAVQELLGHASLSTTQRYTQVTAERVRQLVGILGPEAA